MPVLIWLGDERDPSESRWHSYFPIATPEVVWLRSYQEFIDWIADNSLPQAICFDHDLGTGPSGFEAAKWLTEFCVESGVKLPEWNIQSANPIGKKNIAALLTSFERAMGAS